MRPELPSFLDDDGAHFRAWVTTTDDVAVRLVDAHGVPWARHRMHRAEPASPGGALGSRPGEDSDRGRFVVDLPWSALHHARGAGGAADHRDVLYQLELAGRVVPDPFARELPFGVEGPARLHRLRVTEALPAARRRPAHQQVVYELHVGTFTREGTYAAAVGRLDHLRALGVTAVELMPLAAFPGARGWGYDGVALYAPFAPYGTPDDLRRFVDEAHARDLEVIVDVVYNHFGPSGAYVGAFDRELFTDAESTPWGEAPDFRKSPMRRLALDNARYWFVELGVDGLRLDATHAYVDDPARPILRDLTALAARLDPPRRVYFEDARNDPAQITDLGATGVWADDFHHQAHVLLTGERDAYYVAHEPTLAALARTIRDGFAYTGEPYAPWDGKPRGRPARHLPPHALVYALQTHDQVGNRPDGARLATLVDDDDALLAAAAVLLFLPATPLLFQGEEWATRTPFPFFCDHEPTLAAAVRAGREKELASFPSAHAVPDPQDPATFDGATLDWRELDTPRGARAFATYRSLLALRRDDPVLAAETSFADLGAEADGDVLRVTRRRGDDVRVLLARFGPAETPLPVPADARVLARTPASPERGDLGPGAVVFVPNGGPHRGTTGSAQ